MEDQTSGEYMGIFSEQMGRLVIAVSLFDDDLSDLLAECMCLTPLQENLLLRPLSTRGKVEMLGRIGGAFLKSDNLKLLNKWCRTVKDILDERNELIHGIPGHQDNKIHFRSFAGKNRIVGKPQAWTAEDVSKLADEFILFSEQLNDHLRAVFDVWIESTRAEVLASLSAQRTPSKK